MYTHPNKVIEGILDLAFLDFRDGQSHFQVNRELLQRLHGNPTYIRQYDKTVKALGITTTPIRDKEDLVGFIVSLDADVFTKRLQDEKDEELRKQQEEDLHNDRGMDFMEQVSYSDTSGYFDSRDVTSAVGVIIAKLIKNADYSPRVYILEKDIQPFNSGEATMRMIQQTLSISGVKCYLEDYRDIFESEDKQAIIIHWHDSDLYLGLN